LDVIFISIKILFYKSDKSQDIFNLTESSNEFLLDLRNNVEILSPKIVQRIGIELAPRKNVIIAVIGKLKCYYFVVLPPAHIFSLFSIKLN
jgi:hypothetical protein